MSLKLDRYKKRLAKKARKGLSGYPLATIAYYGPTDKQATKVTVAIIPEQDAEPENLVSWFSDNDIRRDVKTFEELLDYLDKHNVVSVAMTDRIIGCPHQEGIDYPKGETCQECAFWKGRDRWTGDKLH